MGLLFLHGLALSACIVPLGAVLDRAGLDSLKPYAFASMAIASLLSPLFFGAMADRSVPPAQVFRWTTFGAAIGTAVVAFGLSLQVNVWILWGVIQIQCLFSSPTSSLSGSMVFSRLGTTRAFGPIRSLGTIGWMFGCWVISALGLDSRPAVFYLASALWLSLSLFTYVLPRDVVTATSLPKLTLRERFGLDALSLLKNQEYRVIFLTAALVAIPFSAFYPMTPKHLSDLGFERLSAWMSLGQLSEVVALLLMGAILMRWSWKGLLAFGLICGIARYALYSADQPVPLLVGLSLHGLAFTFTSVCSQIYLADRVPPEWRTRAQALLTLMSSGVGSLCGYFLTGAWLRWCTVEGHIAWPEYWLGLMAFVASVFVYFLVDCRHHK
jgi:MFS family permease